MDRLDLELAERQDVAAALGDRVGFVINRTEGFAWREGTATIHTPGCGHARDKQYPAATVDDLIEAVVGEAQGWGEARLCCMCGASAALELPHLGALHHRIFEPLEQERLERATRAWDKVDWQL